MATPLPAPDAQSSDSAPLRPVPLVEESAGRIRAAESGHIGLLCLGVVGLSLAIAACVVGLIVSSWPWTATPLLVLWTVLSFAVGVAVVRAGVSNPWIKKYERWRALSFDWKDRALQGNNELDRVARDFTGEDDPTTARRVFYERLERLKKGPRRGRPRGSRTAMDHETWLEKAGEVRKLRRQEMTWDNIGKRLGISDDTARDWFRSLEAEETDTA